MKKIIMIISASWLMLACSDNSKKEIQQAKMMAIDSMRMQTQIKDAKQEVIDSMKMEAQIQAAKQFTRDSLKDTKKVSSNSSKRYNSANS